jgi:hypothetical protein
MSDLMQGEQKLTGAFWLPAAIPKKTFWHRKLVALGRRLGELLRTEKSSDGREDNTMYFGM